jgi:hypothetical protein
MHSSKIINFHRLATELCKIVKLKFTRFLFTILIIYNSPPLKANIEQEKINRLQIKAKKLHLHKTTRWRKILFIPNRFYESNKSLIDDPKFFLAKRGKTKPLDELNSTIEIFLKQKKITINDREHLPQCVFTARFLFLNKHFNLKNNFNINLKLCTNYNKYLKVTDYQKVSYVFSNYYLNNPSSMFGHTFLRLHRYKDNEFMNLSGQLDDSLNFSAYPTTTNPFLYALYGLMGKFKGRFSLLPYYTKIQEYTNSESRDLWEYELNLNKDDINWLIAVIWEQGNFYSDYFYFDENCSYILLSIIEAAKPSLKLTDQLPLYTIPIDTIKALKHEKAIINIKPKLSNLSRYAQLLQRMSIKEKKLLKQLFIDNSVESVKNTSSCNTKCLIKVLEAAVELVDYKEHLAANMQPIKYKKLRQEILLARSSIEQTTPELEKTPLSSRPDVSHPSAFIGVGSGYNNKNMNNISFFWRPAYHDLAADSRGYSDEMSIKFLDIELSYYLQRKSLKLTKLNLLEIISIPKKLTLIDSWSWALNLEYNQNKICLQKQNYCPAYLVNFGIGKNISLFQDKLKSYFLVGPTVNYMKENDYEFHYGPQVVFGVIAKISKYNKVLFNSSWQRMFGSYVANKLEHNLVVTWNLNKDIEIRNSLQTTKNGLNINLSLLKYF